MERCLFSFSYAITQYAIISINKVLYLQKAEAVSICNAENFVLFLENKFPLSPLEIEALIIGFLDDSVGHCCGGN